MKTSRLYYCLLSMLFLFACADAFELTPPPNFSENPGFIGETLTQTQTVIFQGAGDLSTHREIHFQLPIPTKVVEAKLFVYGQYMNTLYYTELAGHEHDASNTGSHSHGVLGFANLDEGPNSIGLRGNCSGIYFHDETPACGNQSLIKTGGNHSHSISYEGSEPVDPIGNFLLVDSHQKTYPDHVQVLLDGEDITTKFDLETLGDGFAGHDFNSKGSQADLTDLLNQAGHHQMTFRMPESEASQSKGGSIQYVLWLRIPTGDWQSESDGEPT